MKKLFMLILAVLIHVGTYAQQNSQTIVWKVFASGPCNFETLEVGEVKQDFIDVKQEGNRFFWGNDNVYTLYNKKEKHQGFQTVTTYDFIDKYKQRGVFIYTLNRDADWANKHMFWIHYEGIVMGKYYCSNEPVSK